MDAATEPNAEDKASRCGSILDLPPSRFIGQSSKTKLAHSYCDCGTLVYSPLDTFVVSSAD
jgi:hypothetical protein